MSRLVRLRARPVIERNVLSWSKNWWVLLTGIFEPIFYLLGMGLGLGDLVGQIELGGALVDYPTFVASGLMASSAMNGAIYDASFNFYFKLREAHTFDAMLNSPLRMVDVLSGEVLWAVSRGTVYATMFLVVALFFGAVASWWAVLTILASMLLALVFAAVGVLGTTFVRSWADFDLMNLAILPMTMGSTTFFPLSVYPSWAQPIVQATPLYNGVALIRDLNTGLVGWHDIGHVFYLLVLGLSAGMLATRRLARLLIA